MAYQSKTLAFMCVLMIATVGQVKADCFDYKEEFQPLETIRGVQQAEVIEFKGDLTGQKLIRHRDVLIKDGDYIRVVVAAKTFKPAIFITNRGSDAVITQGWSTESSDGFNTAEVHFSGKLANYAPLGRKGQIDIVVKSEDEGVGGGKFFGWIYPIKKMLNLPADYCNSKFIESQGGDVCDTCEPECPPGQEMVGGFCHDECPPGKKMTFNGVCLADPDS